MPSMEETFENACAENIIPGAVLLAANSSGSFKYENVFGSSSLKDFSSKPPLKIDSMMWIASCTKLVTSVAALQLVEKGHLGLDDDVGSILPEVAELEVLTGFDAGKPQLAKRRNQITLRLLLTHSAGLTYDFLDPLLTQWCAYHGRAVGPTVDPTKTVLESYTLPLAYEPGTAWGYGSSIDFVGLMVERVTHLSLQEYFVQNIWQALAIKDIVFHLDQHDELRDRLTDMSMRDPSGGLAIHTPDRFWSLKLTDDYGGAGLYSSPPEYFKLVHAILQNDEQLLKKSTVEKMFKPQLSDKSRVSLMETLASPTLGPILGGLPPELEKDHGLAGLLQMEDLPNSRKKGTLTWGGMPNLTWFVDRDADLCGLYASQIFPLGEPRTLEMREVFQKAMYQKAKQGATKM
ncbi:MAG: hypothetical protein Q9181_007777 [Wetmoreana brouardii]